MQYTTAHAWKYSRIALTPFCRFTEYTIAPFKGEVDQTLEDLYAVLNIPDNPAYLLYLYYPLFRDFLLNKDQYREF